MSKHLRFAPFVALLLAGATIAPPAFAQKSKKKKKEKQEVAAATPAQAPKKDDGLPKPYSQVITEKAVTDEGLFKVHRQDDKYYYEIPDTLLGRDMLMVSRIAKTATNIGYGGEELNTQMLRWEKKGNRILLRVISYENVAADTLEIFHSVQNSNLAPVIQAFDIKAFNTGTSVVEVTDFFSKDVPALGLDQRNRDTYKVRRLDDKRSFVESIKSFPTNIEARSLMTYEATNAPSNSSAGTISLELNHSMVLLPKKPMASRKFDQRVGFFTISQTDYGTDEQRAAARRYIVRWRLEPKDKEAYARGELVEPVKPIVYYIDPATPVKWRKYLKQGVEDWQKAFEAAGFKNAIIAKDPPSIEEDPEFSTEDARYSVIRYFSSDVQNAYGPNVHDPRSGEILESHIGWYHNVMNLLRNWYFIQTAAINPEARKVQFSDEVMGELIRFVSSHEVGHTLGLPHNMGSSAAYPVEKLRNAEFTKKYGTAPSIMDYARFNYIAQPEDNGVALMPGIGIYDKYSVKWGYTYFPEANGRDNTEKLNAWIRQHENDPMYRFGRQQGNTIDPSSQTEDLGDDAMLASTYGIANLKRIMPNLITWTAQENKDYTDLQEMYGQVLGQWNRYMGHVTANVGGVYENYKTYGQKGNVYEPVAKEKQKRAMKFLNEQGLSTPTWMLDETIIRKFESAGTVDRIRNAQVNIVNNLLEPGRMARLLEAQAALGSKAYTLPEMMADLRKGLWAEVSTGKSIDIYRRNLQRGYLERMEFLMKDQEQTSAARFGRGGTPVNVAQSDIRPMVRGELSALRGQIKTSLAKTSDTMTKYHLQDALVRIDNILNPKS
ncbi:zinc-dependent metalloprotease [Pontibacter sp. BT310]|uniref:Zinc-dependent metalloprotease n=1 Tax=Pontibacter populi TaxID=890055 RepID=A0ABS6XBI9_9BACT|nr:MULTISPECIES: zinc-dependent metalloprotease [Pontibacter]MBJ6118378.1 zinc-dependent metalloprotease [Pontibacter sp. BT310]MBR0570805.1 zinc-dependent metalloprotease [Microvirga sp. STS03]MBW3365231.1 zinc-dependent metalloprotease [Pontibacter populi]